MFVLGSLVRAYAMQGIDLKFRHVFSCECKKPLHEWIAGIFQECGVDSGCLFSRAEEMGQELAYCVKHGKKCRVPSANLVIAGTSCKDISRASSVYKGSDNLVMELETSVGGSAQTFKGLVAYLNNHVVSILLFENVDSLDDAGDQLVTNLDLILAELRNTGMSCQIFLTDAKLFGLPQQRRRYYIVGLKDVAPPLFSFDDTTIGEVFAYLRSYMVLCQRQPPCASSVFLDGDDAAIEKELNRRLATGRKQTLYNVAASITQFQGSGLRWGDAATQAETTASDWFKTLANLQTNVLTFSQAEHPRNMLCRDIGQSTSRVRYSQRSEDGSFIAFCQMPGQVAWIEPLVGEQRLQLGRESLLLQGYPIAKVPRLVEKTSERVMQEIGGNMMAATLPLAVLQALFIALPWRQIPFTSDRTEACSEQDVEIAMALFGSLCGAAGADDDASDIRPETSDKRRRRIRHT
jgi:site-specific DNA-cytosine methylase